MERRHYGNGPTLRIVVPHNYDQLSPNEQMEIHLRIIREAMNFFNQHFPVIFTIIYLLFLILIISAMFGSFYLFRYIIFQY